MVFVCRRTVTLPWGGRTFRITIISREHPQRGKNFLIKLHGSMKWSKFEKISKKIRCQAILKRNAEKVGWGEVLDELEEEEAEVEESGENMSSKMQSPRKRQIWWGLWINSKGKCARRARPLSKEKVKNWNQIKAIRGLRTSWNPKFKGKWGDSFHFNEINVLDKFDRKKKPARSRRSENRRSWKIMNFAIQTLWVTRSLISIYEFCSL